MRIYLYLSPWRNRIQKPLFSFIHSCTAKRHFQKSPLWRAFLKRCVFGDRFQRIRVDGRPTSPFSNRNGNMWKVPLLSTEIYLPITLSALLPRLCFVLKLSLKVDCYKNSELLYHIFQQGARNMFLLSLKVDFHCGVIFTCVNRTEAVYERSRENVKVKPCSSFTFTRGLSYIKNCAQIVGGSS